MSRPQSLGRAFRLRSRRDFQAIQRHGRRRHSPHFIVISIDRPAGKNARLGVTVSRAVGNAVVRNRVKRRIREFFRAARARVTARLDLVVIAKPGAGELTSAETATELRASFGF